MADEDDVDAGLDRAHALAEAIVLDRLGRRREALGPLADVFASLVVGLADQLSAYLECRPTTRFEVGAVQIREGAERAYLLAAITDDGRPLRMRGVMAGWDAPLPAGGPVAWVEAQNGRRWRFLDRHRVMVGTLFERLADATVAYYARRPGARLAPAPDAEPRLVEGVDATYLALELDDRAPRGPDDERRHRVE